MPPLHNLKRDQILHSAQRKVKKLQTCTTGSSVSGSKTSKSNEASKPKRSSSTKSLIDYDYEKIDPGFRSHKFSRQDSMNELNPKKRNKIGVYDQSTNILKSNVKYESFSDAERYEYSFKKMKLRQPTSDKSDATQKDKGDQKEHKIEFGSAFFSEELKKKTTAQKNKKQFNGEDMVNTHYLKVLWAKAVISVGIVFTNLTFICMGSLPIWVMIEGIVHMALYTVYLTHIVLMIKNYKIIASAPLDPNTNLSTLSQSKSALNALFKKMSPDSFFGFLATGCLAACVIYSFFVASNMRSLGSESERAVHQSQFVIIFNLAMNITTLLTIIVVAVLSIVVLAVGVILLCGLCVLTMIILSLYALIYFAGFFWVCFGTKFLPFANKKTTNNLRPSDALKKSKQITMEFREKKEQIATLLAKYSKEYRFISTKVTECVLCLDAFKPEDPACKLNCHDRHVFHEICLNIWVLEHETCPLCKNPIDSQPKKPAKKELEDGLSIFVKPIIKKRSKSHEWARDSDPHKKRRFSLDGQVKAKSILDNYIDEVEGDVEEDEGLEVLDGGIIKKINGHNLGLQFSSDESSGDNLRQCGTNFSNSNGWKSKDSNDWKSKAKLNKVFDRNFSISQNVIAEENEELEQSSIYEDIKKADIRRLSKPKSLFKTQMVKSSNDFKKPKKLKKPKKEKSPENISSSDYTSNGERRSDATNPFDVQSDSRNSQMSSN